MQIRSILIIFSLIIICSQPSFASRNLLPLNVFHINGINTLKKEADENMFLLGEAAKIDYPHLSWTLLYNETHGLLKSDIFDVLRQKNQEGRRLDMDDFTLAYIEQHHLAIKYGSPEYERLRSRIKDLYAEDLRFVGINFKDILDQYHKTMAAAGKTIANLLKGSNGNKEQMALFISHSQGGLYVNQLIDYIIDEENAIPRLIAQYAIASPAARDNFFDDDDEPVKFGHMTATNDFVIKAMRIYSTFIPYSNLPMYANIDLNICNDNILCHGLATAYLANAGAIRKLSSDIDGLIKRLVRQNCN